MPYRPTTNRIYTTRPPDTRPSAAKRGYGSKWRQVRAAFLKSHPVCVECGLPSKEAHHVKSKDEGGTDQWCNLLPLCKRCHSKATRAEHKEQKKKVYSY